MAIVKEPYYGEKLTTVKTPLGQLTNSTPEGVFMRPVTFGPNVFAAPLFHLSADFVKRGAKSAVCLRLMDSEDVFAHERTPKRRSVEPYYGTKYKTDKPITVSDKFRYFLTNELAVVSDNDDDDVDADGDDSDMSDYMDSFTVDLSDLEDYQVQRYHMRKNGNMKIRPPRNSFSSTAVSDNYESVDDDDRDLDAELEDKENQEMKLIRIQSMGRLNFSKPDYLENVEECSEKLFVKSLNPNNLLNPKSRKSSIVTKSPSFIGGDNNINNHVVDIFSLEVKSLSIRDDYESYPLSDFLI
ncbi:uncharacterized protein KQ657_004180 [Scheffersomyces spartinae]|uniref:Uncharacterized protein n=1 Tax=Scheffersomyces spartinae TaxID=45513 RepID=A0A9P7VCN5_9ASCO|nr:uncharacterized protein KQ657_004180 [Scheffersomyces spartinae]KAG7195066.1 hypothetical protein KQ657_004180 [Scheffersomyces spartinae]